jgi:hypothetical protein
VFETLKKAVRVEIGSLVRTVIWAAVASAMALVGVFFLAVTVFIWTSGHYGHLAAAIAMVVYFLIVAGIAGGILLLVRSKARKAAAKRAETQTINEQQRDQRMGPIWKDPGVMPAVLPVALKVAQFGFRYRALIGVTVSSAAIVFALLRHRQNERWPHGIKQT